MVGFTIGFRRLVAIAALAGTVAVTAGTTYAESATEVAAADDLLLAPAQPAKSADDLLAPAPAAKSADDLLAPAPAAKGADDLLAPAPAGKSADDLLAPAPAGKSADDLLAPGPAKPEGEEKTAKTKGADKQHADLFLENRYPSANTCATCHPKQYREWSVSQHAYAQLSPVYMSMQMTINALTSSTNGDFCIRCHNQVGMNLGESLFVSNLERHPTSREGITCVVCHRVNRNYGKVSGRLALAEGDLYSPIYGPTGGKELKRVLSKPGEYRVSPSREKAGRGIHAKAEKFFQLSTPGFCATCHDVTLLNGFRLEEAFAEYKQSPSSKEGETCQDCHMGKVQGVASGYEHGPAAMVGGVPTTPRKLTNHLFAGPDYSIIHPGIFPHNVEAARLKSLGEWLEFDYEAGWGTDKFEDNLPKDYKFPESWASIDDRYDARAILNEQFKRLEFAREKRIEVLRNAFDLSDIRVTKAGHDALDFEIDVKNLTRGHAVPTGFDAERLIYLEVMVRDGDGKLVYQSGDRDPNGDVRDAHSLYVHNGELPLDKDLFNLQSKFIVRPVRGAEREKVLAVNLSANALPFIRPERRPTTLYGRPRGARKHKQTIEPLGRRTASYSVPSEQLSGKGPYHISVKLITQMIPVNLVAAISGVGFDYNMSPRQIADGVVKGAMVIRQKKITAGPMKTSDGGDGRTQSAAVR